MTFGREMMGWDLLKAWIWRMALWQLSPWIWGLACNFCSCIPTLATPLVRGRGWWGSARGSHGVENATEQS